MHTGPAFVGYISRGEASEFTAFGDTINVTAHLAAQARAGEILDHRRGGGVARDRGSRATPLSLKGHELDALVITIDERGPAEAGVA